MVQQHRLLTPSTGSAGNHVIHDFEFASVDAMVSGSENHRGTLSKFVLSDVGRVARVGSSPPYSFFAVQTEGLDFPNEDIWISFGSQELPPPEINLALDGSQTGMTELHVGSVYLKAGTTISTDSVALLGTEAGGTALMSLKRFDGGALILTLSYTGVGLGTASVGVAVPILSDGFYDLFVYGDAGPTVSLIKGLRLVMV